ncbi:Hypothetical predicted protein [Cloeon dipterum]|uniref:Uncharacterized protein n=1 Tax=Cloeon dipterum TaxID=197152 RepID=A0A8S1CKX5_9INSE|nr:Hypothetical predicted protein [Cloeon dipterum]
MMSVVVARSLDGDEDMADGSTLADIWSALQETNSNLQKCNEIINKFYFDTDTKPKRIAVAHEEATFTLSENSTLIGVGCMDHSYQTKLPPEMTENNRSTENIDSDKKHSLKVQNNASAAARPQPPKTSARKSKPKSGRRSKTVAKLRKRLSALKREVRVRDLRLGQLEGAVGALADLSTRSQRAYYVLLHEIARQLFETADLLQVGGCDPSARPAPTASLAPWFETLYLLSRKIKQRLLQSRTTMETPTQNGSLEIRSGLKISAKKDFV